MIPAVIVAGVAVGLILASTVAPSARAQNAPVSERDWTIPGNDQIRRLLVDRFEDRSVGVVVGVLEPGGTRIVTFGTSGAADRRALDGETVFRSAR